MIMHEFKELSTSALYKLAHGFVLLVALGILTMHEFVLESSSSSSSSSYWRNHAMNWYYWRAIRIHSTCGKRFVVVEESM
jgi:hypothetical protein